MLPSPPIKPRRESDEHLLLDVSAQSVVVHAATGVDVPALSDSTLAACGPLRLCPMF